MIKNIIWFTPDKRHKYPHMSPADTIIWERFLDTNPDFLKSVAYDVRVGDGQDPGDSYEENIRAMAIKLTQYRIDVLNHNSAGYQIIEVKQDPGPGAIGQLLSYKDLFSIKYPEARPIHLLLLCNKITQDLIKVCHMNLIDFIVT